MQHWQAQAHALQQTVDQQHQSISTLQKDLAVLTEKHASSEKTVKSLTAQNKSLAHEKWIVDQEKAKLLGQCQQLQSIKSPE